MSLLMDQVPHLLYGLPKIHQTLIDVLPKCEPILSQIGSLTCKIAKCLLNYTSPIDKNKYTLKDSVEFVFIINKKIALLSSVAW